MNLAPKAFVPFIVGVFFLFFDVILLNFAMMGKDAGKFLYNPIFLSLLIGGLVLLRISYVGIDPNDENKKTKIRRATLAIIALTACVCVATWSIGIITALE